MKQKIESIFRHVIAAILAVEIEALMNKFGISLDYNGLGLCINYQGKSYDLYDVEDNCQTDVLPRTFDSERLVAEF